MQGTYVQAWPPTLADSPGAWGDIPYTSDNLPEGFGISFVLALSALAVVVGSVVYVEK